MMHAAPALHLVVSTKRVQWLMIAPMDRSCICRSTHCLYLGSALPRLHVQILDSRFLDSFLGLATILYVLLLQVVSSSLLGVQLEAMNRLCLLEL